MNRQYVRSSIAAIILAITAAATVYFLRSHPTVGQQLADTPLHIVIILLGLYFLFMVSLWLIFQASLTLCKASLPARETTLVTAYSSIINFFGPLQSGPAFRAIYLKKLHKVSLKKYALASLVYYFFYAYYSGLFILSGLIGWWTVMVIAISLILFFGLLQLPLPKLQEIKQLNRLGFIQTAVATGFQVCILVLIFYIELHSINPSISLHQAVTYTGAANYALFVSITPGAIGFRETFVLLTEQLHHIPTATVVAASLLDRGVYVGMLFDPWRRNIRFAGSTVSSPPDMTYV